MYLVPGPFVTDSLCFLTLVRWATLFCHAVLPQNSGNHRLWMETTEATVLLSPPSPLNWFSWLFFVIVIQRLTLTNTVSAMHMCTGSVHVTGSHFLIIEQISVHSTFKALENICSQGIKEEGSRKPNTGGELRRRVWEAQKRGLPWLALSFRPPVKPSDGYLWVLISMLVGYVTCLVMYSFLFCICYYYLLLGVLIWQYFASARHVLFYRKCISGF